MNVASRTLLMESVGLLLAYSSNVIYHVHHCSMNETTYSTSPYMFKKKKKWGEGGWGGWGWMDGRVCVCFRCLNMLAKFPLYKVAQSTTVHPRMPIACCQGFRLVCFMHSWLNPPHTHPALYNSSPLLGDDTNKSVVQPCQRLIWVIHQPGFVVR